MTGKRPVVGLPCDVKVIGGLPFHAAGEKYIDAVRDVADAVPILIPVPKDPILPDEILELVDGLLLAGSLSNVAPEHYGGAPPRPGNRADPQRDQHVLPLIKPAIEAGLPLFGICRGMQELNVALGGTLEPFVHEREGRIDHREDEAAREEVRYGPAHDITLARDGMLTRLTGAHGFKVNSLHSQAIDRLAPGLQVEATAPDGTVEAVSMPGAKGFLLAVQWHPEWRARNSPVSIKLFEAFGDALRKRRAARR